MGEDYQGIHYSHVLGQDAKWGWGNGKIRTGVEWGGVMQ